MGPTEVSNTFGTLLVNRLNIRQILGLLVGAWKALLKDLRRLSELRGVYFFLRPSHKSDSPLRAQLIASLENGIEPIETGTLIDHFGSQKYSIVALTYENQFTG
jgi:hypothetical protein